jgi:hypothetical protein
LTRLFLLAATAALLAGCGSASKPAEKTEAKTEEPPKPADETRRFPTADQVSTQVVNNHIMNKAFMPGGTIAHYKKGATEYDMFVAQFPTSTDAAIALANWDGVLQAAKLVPTFGGYFGADGGRPAFVFPKDRWVAGVVGLPQAQADPAARVLASRLN